MQHPSTARAIAIGALVVLGIGGAAAVATARDERTAVSSASYPAAPRISVDTGAGDIRVVAAPVSEITVERRTRTTAGDAGSSVTRVGDVLDVHGGCRHGWQLAIPLLGPSCRVSFVIKVPPGTAVTVENGLGDVAVSGVAGDVDITSGTGDVKAEGIAARRVSLSTGTGDVTATMAEAPDSLEASSGTGDVTATVPSGAYRLDLSTGVGDTSTTGIQDDPTSPHLLSLSTGTGDVTAIGTGR